MSRLKNSVRACLMPFLVVLLALLVPAPALAAGSTDPVIYEPAGFSLDLAGIEITPATAAPGDTIHLSATCETEVNTICLTFAQADGGTASKSFDLTDPDGDGVYTYDYAVPEGAADGTYTASVILVWFNKARTSDPEIVIRDSEGNDAVNTFRRDLSSVSFAIVSEDADTTPPTVNTDSLAASPKSATLGDTITVSVEAYDDFGMTSDPNAGVTIEYRNANYRTLTINLHETSPGVFTGELEVTRVLANDAGPWMVHHITATDDAGNTTTLWDQRNYSGSQNYSAGDFELVDMPSPVFIGFDVGYDEATIVASDEPITVGTRVRFTVPISSTNGLTSARVTFWGGDGCYVPVDLTNEGDGIWAGSVYVPVGKGAGNWRAGQVDATDASGATFSTMLRDFTGYDGHPSAPGLVFYAAEKEGVERDEIPPVLSISSCSVSPQTIRRTQTLTYTVYAQDNVGVSYALVSVVGPSGSIDSPLNCYVSFDNEGFGVSSSSFYGTDYGTWRVLAIEAHDAAGNVTTCKNSYFYPDDENAVDLSWLDVEYANDSDGAGPDPIEGSVKTTPKRAKPGDTVTISVDILDNQGVSNARLELRERSDNWLFVPRTVTLHKGEGDTWVGEYTVQPGDPSGPWYVCRIIAQDTYGVTSYNYDYRFQGIGSKNYSSGDFTVYGTVKDTVGPQIDLSSLSVTPTATADGKDVTIRVRVTDNLSGVAEVTIPYGILGENSAANLELQRVGNTDWFEYRATYGLSGFRNAEPGDIFYAWYITAVDNAGNRSGVNNESHPNVFSKYPLGNLDALDLEVVDPESRTDISNATVTLAGAPFVYDGAEKTPAATVTLDGVTLSEGTDYAVVYDRNVNAGTATVVVSGTGSYYGTASKRFLITPRPLSSCDVTPAELPEQYYEDAPVCPEVGFSYGGNALVKGTDFKLRYANNSAPGNATLTAAGRGNFTGTVTIPFDILDPTVGRLEENVANLPDADDLTKDDLARANEVIDTYDNLDDEHKAQVAPWIVEKIEELREAAARLDCVPMYRMYNRWSYEHFYTSDPAERDSLVAAGWTYESVGWWAPKLSNTPVYRLYNKWAPGGDHHYTMDKSEYDYLVSVGWTGEGIGWYSDDAQTVPVYREYNPWERAHNHNYTASESEHQMLIKAGWNDEGIGWYGTEPGDTRSVPPVVVDHIEINGLRTTAIAGELVTLTGIITVSGGSPGSIKLGGEIWCVDDGTPYSSSYYAYSDELRQYWGAPEPSTFPEAGSVLTFEAFITSNGSYVLADNCTITINGQAVEATTVYKGYAPWGPAYQIQIPSYTITVG